MKRYQTMKARCIYYDSENGRSIRCMWNNNYINPTFQTRTEFALHRKNYCCDAKNCHNCVIHKMLERCEANEN